MLIYLGSSHYLRNYLPGRVCLMVVFCHVYKHSSRLDITEYFNDGKSCKIFGNQTSSVFLDLNHVFLLFKSTAVFDGRPMFSFSSVFARFSILCHERSLNGACYLHCMNKIAVLFS